eukprot:5674186-Prymnesium_polylepis.2
MEVCVGTNNINNDCYPASTFEFMKYLMATWLHLPCLSNYVFDTGDYDQGFADGNDLQFLGYFRSRANGEKGIFNPAEDEEECDLEENLSLFLL